MAQQEPSVKEPRHVIVDEVCEVPALHVAIQGAESRAKDHRSHRGTVSLH